MGQSHLEIQFEQLWLSLYPDVDLWREYRACPPRRYRWDYAHLGAKVLIEIQGGIWQAGGHSTGRGLMRDYEKLNLAAAHGWRQFSLSAEMITAEWLDLIAKSIEASGQLASIDDALDKCQS